MSSAGSWTEELERSCRDFPGRASVFVLDTAGGERFEYDADTRLHSASLIKLFILWHLFERADSGDLALSEEAVLSPGAAVEGGVLHRALPGARLRLDDLALLMLAVSDNTAANILIDRLGIDAVNASIRNLGCAHTVLGRKMLDFEARRRGLDNYTCARETGELLVRMAQRGGRMLDLLSVQKNVSKFASGIPFDDADDLEVFLAHKTGELPEHEHDAGILFHRTGRPIVAVALTAGPAGREAGCRFCGRVGSIVYERFGAERLAR